MAERNTYERARGRKSWMVGGLLATTLALLPAAGAAGSGAAWDDSHMRSRHGGPRTAPAPAPRIDGENRFSTGASAAPAPTGVAEQWLPGSQHPWSRRASGLGNVPGGPQAARRPAVQTESRHTRNPGAWSRSTASSSLRAGSVRRSAGGR